MKQGEASRKPALTAPVALDEALAIARDLTNGMSAFERGKLWLDIAHELRSAADERLRRRFAELSTLAPQPLAAVNAVTESPNKFDIMFDVARRLREQRMPAGTAREASDEHEASEVPQADDEALRRAFTEAANADRDLLAEAATQAFTSLPWSVGDRSECRFCGTPITMNEFMVWFHRYTDQVVCAAPVAAEQISGDAIPEHTYATPVTARRGV